MIKRKKTNDKEIQCEECNIELLSTGFDSFSFFYSENPSSNCVRIQGTVFSRSYFISGNPTYDEILKSLKSDIISSLKHSLSIWYDELENTNQDLFNIITKDKSQLESSASWVFPRRVLLPFQNTPVLVCDYIFPTEESKDDKEKKPTIKKQEQKTQPSQTQPKTLDSKPPTIASSNYKIVFVALIFVLVAWIIFNL